MSRLLRLVVGLACLSILACGSKDVVVAPQTAPVLQIAKPAPEAVPVEEPVVDTGDPGPVPVTAADPVRGPRNAPVTIVEFGDFQCPFTARVQATLAQILATYGPTKVRVVWKNNPLPFHPNARPSAAAAAALFERGGNEAFWRAHDAYFAEQSRLGELTADTLSAAGIDAQNLDGSDVWRRAQQKIDADLALATTTGVAGTPHFLINGVRLSGAQPYEKFAAVIDEQLVKANERIAKGTPPFRLYAELAKAQFQLQPPPAERPSDAVADADKPPRRVPVGGSPVRGKATAPVTIVEFADFQCPYCGRVAATIKQIEAEYGDKVRFVFKHNPLPFHPHAEPAAELAMEARAEKGDRGFWAAHDLLFRKECAGAGATHDRQACMDAGGTWIDHQTRLEEADLLGYARELGLSEPRVLAAINTKRHAAAITQDAELAEDLSASGTPSFFINGRLLVGAQPVDSFKKVIDAEIARAADLVKQGTPATKVYEKLQSTAQPGGVELVKKVVSAPPASSPSRGPSRAKVVIQMFSDFQCPFCSRVTSTLEELLKAYPTEVRLVWRNKPLPFHQNAERASEAALEALQQKGNDGFWAMYAILFANQAKLDRASLDGYAAQLGLDPTRFAYALDNHTHKPEIDADAKLADSVDISGTPTFLINGYLVSGAQPLSKFRRVVERALAEAK